MTDECFAENAELECERLLTEAIKLDDHNYEALQLMGSFRISQDRKEDAINFLLQSKASWNDSEEAPPFELRINASKLFLELEQHNISAEILEELVSENDSDSEAWFLYAFSLSPDEPKEAKEALDKCCELISMSGCNDPNIMAQIEELNTRIINSPLYKANDIDVIDDDGEDLSNDAMETDL